MLEADGFALVGNGELGVDRGRHRVLAQQPGAEAVHRGYPGPFQRTAYSGGFGKLLRQFLAHVGGGLFGKGDGQNAQRVDARLHQAAKVFHQHGGLSGAGPGHYAGVLWEAGHLDGAGLRGSELDRVHSVPSAASTNAWRARDRQASR